MAILATGAIYIGELWNNKIDGEGKLYLPDSSELHGKFKEGKPVGTHEFFEKDGTMSH